MKTYRIHFSASADRDLNQIQAFLVESEGPARTEYVMSLIEAVIMSLERTPERGVVPPELNGLGHRELREVSFKPYRVFYWIGEGSVDIGLVADGRRDMRAILQQRLLGAPTQEG